MVVTALNLGGGDIENSFAVARDVYVVSGAALYRLGPGRRSAKDRVADEYDRGTMRNPVRPAAPRGPPPTVFGQWWRSPTTPNRG